MTKHLHHFIFLCFLFVLLYNPEDDFYFSRWLSACLVLTIGLCYFIYKKTHIIVALFCGSTLISSILVFGLKFRYSPNFDGQAVLALDNSTLYAGFTFLLVITFLLNGTKYLFDSIESALAGLCMANTLVFLVQYLFFGPVEYYGLFGNASMNGSLIAMTYPFLVQKPEVINYYQRPLKEVFKKFKSELFLDFICVILPIIAILLHKQSIPVIALFMSLSYLTIKNLILEKQFMFFTFVLACFIGLASWFIPDFFNSTGRFRMYELTITWLIKYVNPILGTGNGTTVLFLPFIQREAGDLSPYVFGWLHNDFLQVLFEQGISGFLSALALAIYCLIKSYRENSYLFNAACIYIIVSLFNFPAHTPVHAFIGAFIVAKITLKETYD